MKRKQLIIMGAFIAISCHVINAQNSISTITLETRSDSIGYGVGLAQSQYAVNPNMQLSNEQRKMFLKGLMEAQAKTEADSLQKAYYMGLAQGLQFVDENFEQFNKQLFEEEADQYIRKEIFLAGLEDGISGGNTKLGMDTLNQFLDRVVGEAQAEVKAKKYTDNKKAGEDFLKANKKKKGVKTLPSGLQYKVITKGKGKTPKEDDTVKVHYKGTLIDGTEFDSSYARNEPAKFGVKSVIKGWTEALQLMPVGSKWEIYVPYNLAYGDKEIGSNIKPFSALIFEIELLDFEEPAIGTVEE